MIEINDKNYNKLIDNEENPFIILLKSNNCPYCVEVENLLKKIEKDKNRPENLKIYIAQGELSPRLIQKYNIRSFPSTFFFKQDKTLNKAIIGSTSISDFVSNIEAIYKKKKENKLINFIKGVFN